MAKKFYWRCRKYAHDPLYLVWLIEVDGAAHSGILHGALHFEQLERLKEKFADWEWKEENVNLAPYTLDSPLKTCKQPDLFDQILDTPP